MSAADFNVLDQLIPIRTVCQRIGVSQSKVYAMVAAGEFPKPTHIGSSARWSERELQFWLNSKLAEREVAS